MALCRTLLPILRDAGLKVWDVEIIRINGQSRAESHLPLMEAAALLGARRLKIVCDSSDHTLAADVLGRLCRLAAPFGLTCDLEFIPWLRTKDLADVAALIRAAGPDNGGVMIDTLHFARAGCTLEELDALPPQWFHYVQLCDAPLARPSTVEGLIYAAREERLFPGEGELDLAGIMARLPSGIPVALEIPTETLAFTSAPEERLRAAREASLRVLSA